MNLPLKSSKFTDQETIIDALKASPQVRAALSEREKRLLEERRRSAARLTAIEEESSAIFSAGQKLQAETLARVKEAQAALQAATNAYNNAVIQRAGELNRLSVERERIEQFLCDGASDEISKFVDDLRGEIETTRRDVPVVFTNVERNPNTGATKRTVEVLGTTPGERLAAIRAAIAAAEALRLEPDQATVPARLEALRAALPAVGEIKKGLA